MIKFAFFLSVLIIINLLPVDGLAQTGYSITNKLYEESDVILQGKLKRVCCWLDDVGVGECEYTISVDSIYKGLPRIYKVSILEFENENIGQDINPSEIDKTIDVTYFMRECPYYLNIKQNKIPIIQDRCFAMGDSLIVFLKDNISKKELIVIPADTIYYYDLIDQWSGIFYPSSYLAMYLRRASTLK
jgi:hypothetical protein